MAKICETSFNGGQSIGVTYQVYTGVLQKNTGAVSENRLVESFFQGTGPISNIKIIEDIPLDNGKFLRRVQWFGIRGDGTKHFLGGSSGTIPTDSPLPDADLIYFRVTRADGKPERICKCEPTDQTIQCVGQEGDICCISTSIINELCQRLR